MDTPSRHELTQAEFDNINVNRGVNEDTMRDLGYDTLESLPATIDRIKALGRQAVEPMFHVNQIGQSTEPAEVPEPAAGRLELVTPDHKPLPGVKRAATLRTPPKPRNWRERQAADQPPESQRPPEWDESRALRVLPGSKADRR
ncbi:MAG TPA: hypothetical protein VHC21_01175 [Candidatus Saccharimonadales bacterium]|nr:hypothetical protein [Candidatus Saccharimonadales bacterium]